MSEKPVNTAIYWYHGWACTPAIWTDMVPLIDVGPGGKMMHHFCSRGYNEWYPAREIQLDTRAERHVIVTHSMGGLFVDQYIARRAEYCFVISGFINFHDINPAASKTILRRMIRAFGHNPENVLNEFYQNMTYPLQEEEQQQVIARLQQINCKETLYADLLMLNEAHISPEYLAGIPNVFIFHGLKDRIVPSQHADLLANHCQSKVHLIDNGGHALPLTHVGELASVINNTWLSPKN